MIRCSLYSIHTHNCLTQMLFAINVSVLVFNVRLKWACLYLLRKISVSVFDPTAVILCKPGIRCQAVTSNRLRIGQISLYTSSFSSLFWKQHAARLHALFLPGGMGAVITSEKKARTEIGGCQPVWCVVSGTTGT